MDRTEQIEKYKNLVINAVAICIALIIAFNIYQANLSALASLKDKISEEEKKNSELEKIGKMERKIQAYKKLLVKREASAVMNDISEMARSAGIMVVSLKPSQRETRDDYIKDNFDVSVNAPDYKAVARFLYMVESYNNVYIVDSIDINNKIEPRKSGLMVNLRISSVVAAGQ